jgi:hypothetical protein
LLWKQKADHRPADPEIITTKYTHAKSQKFVVKVSKNKHDMTVVVNSKSKRIATQVSIWEQRLRRLKPTLTTLQTTLHNQLTPDISIGYTVKNPRSALETDKHPYTIATNTSHQVKSQMMEQHLTMVEERKYVKPEEPEEIDKTHTDRNIQHEQVESEKKLVTARRQVRDLDKVRNTVKRPKTAFDAHENPHTPTTSPPEEPFQPSENAEPSPTTRKVPPVKSSSIFNPTLHSPSHWTWPNRLRYKTRKIQQKNWLHNIWREFIKMIPLPLST